MVSIYVPRNDAISLYRAFKGLCYDTSAIINILAHRDAKQRALIEVEYEKLYSQSLAEKLSSKLSGNFKEAVLLWMHDPAKRDAMVLHDVLTTDIDLKAAIEVICSRTPTELRDLNQWYCQGRLNQLGGLNRNKFLGPFSGNLKKKFYLRS